MTPKEGPPTFACKSKNADRQDWYIYVSEFQIKMGNLLTVQPDGRSRSGSCKSNGIRHQQTAAEEAATKDEVEHQEIMIDLMTDIVHLQKRLSTQLQVAPFLSSSNVNVMGSRKVSFSKLEDEDDKSPKFQSNEAVNESINTTDLIEKLAEDTEHTDHTHSSLENFIIHVPQINFERLNQDPAKLQTKYPKVKRSRTFSDIHEISYASSKESSASSLNVLHRSHSEDKMQRYSLTKSESGQSSQWQLLLPKVHHCAQKFKRSSEGNINNGIEDITEDANKRSRLFGVGGTPSVTPEETPAHTGSNTTPKRPATLVDVTDPNLNDNRKRSQAQMSHFQRQMRKLLRRVEKKAEKQRKEILLARLVLLCAAVFLITWVPFAVSILFFYSSHTVKS